MPVLTNNVRDMKTIMSKTVDTRRRGGWQALQILVGNGWTIKYIGLHIHIYLLEKVRVS